MFLMLSRNRRGTQSTFLGISVTILLYGSLFHNRQYMSVTATSFPDNTKNNHASPRTVTHHDYDFDRMSKLIKRLNVLEFKAPDSLLGFYEPDLHTFCAKAGDVGRKERVCITSSCYSLLTLTLGNTGKAYDHLISMEDEDEADDEYMGLLSTTSSNTTTTASDARYVIPIRKVLKALLTTSSWREDDIFQAPLLLYTLLKVDEDKSLIQSVVKQDEAYAQKLSKLITCVLSARPHRHYGLQQEHSDYIIYQVCKVVSLLRECERDLPSCALPENVSSEIFWALLRCAEVSSNELCRQLAYRAASDSTSFDVIRLAYSLLTYLRSTQSLTGIAGKELEPGKGPAPETRITPLNSRLVEAALAAFFEEQNPNGLWDKGQPIYKSINSSSSRNMGHAFVFPVNTVGSLLCALPAEYFRPHLAALEKMLAWIESHQNSEMVTTYTDPRTGQCYGKTLRGWRSPHLDRDDGPRCWSTAQTLKCITWLKIRIQQLIHNDVLDEFNGERFSEAGIQRSDWDCLLDSDLGDASQEGGCRTIKSVLDERMIRPFSSSFYDPKYGAAYSAILFGPPGTAKTSICEAFAQRMGYDFCVIDTAAFLADGLSNVSARIKYVFRRLMALNKCVVLFDEIEEFALDRENTGLSMESRMLTTAMLTAINDLRRNRQCIFFIATNRLRAFDSAITRPGRFDMQLFVGTPNLESRVSQFREMLTVDARTRERAVQAFHSFLQVVWSQDVMFMNYLEAVQFASACADVVADTGELSNEKMSSILKQQSAVMTVRGNAPREEYISSMSLSRF